MEYVLLVYCLPGAAVKRIVLVQVPRDHRDTLLCMQSKLVEKYMSYAYNPDAPRELPSLGPDGSDVYGYAEEHATLEEALLQWIAQTDDVLKNGTPPPWRRVTSFMVHLWNKCMGNIDNVRKIVKKRRAVRGPDSGPGSLMIFNMFDYALYNGLRNWQHSVLESQVSLFTSFRQFQKARQKITYTKFLFKLLEPSGFGILKCLRYYPGL